ncbi:beta-1,4-galactosyltransferase 4 [Ambystoma mexicanum]|uniref:beta-1,4-galactosyltransferase 4 n=1 Tax=Ambystoma mexicanum TaxID=8296 RepID=UPI0037E98521
MGAVHLLCRFRLLLLFALCLVLAGWATSNFLSDSLLNFPKSRNSQANEMETSWSDSWEKIRKNAVVKREGQEAKPLPAFMESADEADLRLCPALSPYLKGSLKLSFQASLTLERVRLSNPKVLQGRYHPNECRPLQRVAILIPHRSREKHLLYLLQHLHPFLQRQQLEYGIYVIHQAGEAKFNRAKLLNVGYLEALKEHNWDCFIFHDVDLVPENDFNLYLCDNEPKHLVVGRNVTGYRLRYKGYFGGVTAMTREQFAKVNGYSNNYWGWGGEDDDLRERVSLQKMKVVRPSPDVAKYTMVFHTRDSGNEVNRDRMKLLRRVAKVWQSDGLNTCSYKVLTIEHNPLYINVTADLSDSTKIL